MGLMTSIGEQFSKLWQPPNAAQLAEYRKLQATLRTLPKLREVKAARLQELEEAQRRYDAGEVTGRFVDLAKEAYERATYAAAAAEGLRGRCADLCPDAKLQRRKRELIAAKQENISRRYRAHQTYEAAELHLRDWEKIQKRIDAREPVPEKDLAEAPERLARAQALVKIHEAEVAAADEEMLKLKEELKAHKLAMCEVP